MTIDIAREKKKVLDFLFKKIEQFGKGEHTGLGKASQPVNHIHLGYQFDDGAWIAVIFDTRDDASADGEWALAIEHNTAIKDLWHLAVSKLEKNSEAITVLEQDGSKYFIGSFDDDAIATLFGKMLKECLIEAKRDGFFQGLPLGEQALFSVEEINGGYGWPSWKDRITEGAISK